VSRRRWLAAAGTFAGSSWLTTHGSAQPSLLPLHTSGLDHLSMTVPDSQRAAAFYGKIFDPQLFREREGMPRYYVRLGAAYIAFGQSANANPYIDHFCAGVLDFKEAETRAAIAAAGITANRGVLPMFSDPDQIRLQLVDAPHGLFDTIMPAGRVTPEPAALVPIGLDHITLLVSNLEQSSAHYRKLFGAEKSRERNPQRVWFQVAATRLGLEAAPAGQKPGIDHFCVKVAGFNRTIAVTRLQQLGVHMEASAEKGPLRFRDLHNIPVEVVPG
jgi:catechol 2,3-dioxygenase-like lactoylglutathione lyase family enzyme